MSKPIPLVSGARPDTGHLQEFNTTPLEFLHRAYRECGEISEFDLGGLRTVLLVGPKAHEAFFRTPDEQLSAAHAFQIMHRQRFCHPAGQGDPVHAATCVRL